MAIQWRAGRPATTGSGLGSGRPGVDKTGIGDHVVDQGQRGPDLGRINGHQTQLGPATNEGGEAEGTKDGAVRYGERPGEPSQLSTFAPWTFTICQVPHGNRTSRSPARNRSSASR